MPAAGILGWDRSKNQRPILHNSKSPETPRKLFLEIIKNTERKKYQRGPTPLPRGPPVGPPVPIFCYMKSFVQRKIISKLSWRDSAAMRRNIGGTNLGLWQSCSAGDTSLRETEIITIIITNAPLIERGQSSSTSSSAPSPLKPQFISCIQFLSLSLGLVLVGCQQC